MTDNRTTELLPCPFCGSEARMLGTEHQWFNPACSNPDCGCEWTDSYTTEAEAIAAWNTRAKRGTLTADQVRKVLLYHLPHREYYSVEQTDAWQAIADELNAELGSGTCHMSFIDEYETASGEEEYLCDCSECGYRRWEHAHDLPLFCSKCGRKVTP